MYVLNILLSKGKVIFIFFLKGGYLVMLKNILEESIFYLNKSIIYLNDLYLLITIDNSDYLKVLDKFENNFNSFFNKISEHIDLFRIIFFKEINNEEVLSIFEYIFQNKEKVLGISDFSSKEDILIFLNEFLNNLSNFLNYLSSVFTLFPNNELKSWELVVLDSFFNKMDLNYSSYMKLLLNELKDYYEVFLKIRGDLLGQDLQENILKIISFIKDVVDSLEDRSVLSKANDYIMQLKEIDEYIQEIDSKASDYEYYIVSKDIALTRIPFANIWFEFILYSYWIYENYVSINSFKNLYEYKVRNSFDKAFEWYQVYINRIFNKQALKNESYENIKNKINKIKDFINSLYLQIVNNYPNKVEISSDWANLFYDILNSMNKLENEIHIRFDSKELKGAGVFENLYDIVYRVYSEDLSISAIYNFYIYFNDVITDLQKNEHNLLTPYDKIILDNIDLFNEFLNIVNNYLSDYENKDLLVDLWLYFENKIKNILLNILQDYKEVEELFVVKKIICVKCGFENEYYNEYCVKCNSKLIKPPIETKSNLKLIFDKFRENYLNNTDYSKFLYAFINLINNSFINFESIYKNLENLPKEGEIIGLLSKIENILVVLADIRNNISLFNDITDESEKQELLETMENNIIELEKILNDFNDYISSFQANVRSI